MTYIKYIFKYNSKLTWISIILIASLQSLIIWLFSTIGFSSFMKMVLSQLPSKLQIFISSQFISILSIEGAVAFGFNHPLVLVLLIINAIIVPVNHIAGEIESGAMEILLSTPFKRKQLYLYLFCTSIVRLFIIISVVSIFSILAVLMFHQFNFLILDIVIKISLNLWFIMALISSYSMVISVFSNDSNRVGLYCVLLTFIFYFFNFISSIWDWINFLRPINIFTYYEPHKLILNEVSFINNLIVLLIFIVITYLIGYMKFMNRDIP